MYDFVEGIGDPEYEQRQGVKKHQAYYDRWSVIAFITARQKQITYGEFKLIARHVRRTYSGSENSLHAYMYYDGETYESNEYKFSILDRVGSGDAFSSGLIYAYMKGMKAEDMINFAVASSVMKHTIHGDMNITDDVQSIYDLMNQQYDVRR